MKKSILGVQKKFASSPSSSDYKPSITHQATKIEGDSSSSEEMSPNNVLSWLIEKDILVYHKSKLTLRDPRYTPQDRT